MYVCANTITVCLAQGWKKLFLEKGFRFLKVFSVIPYKEDGTQSQFTNFKTKEEHPIHYSRCHIVFC